MLSSFREVFSALPEPRVHINKIRYKLIDLVIMAVCAVVGGADDWVAIEDFVIAKRTWFSTFVDLSGGIPSHDTFSRVFSLLDEEQFSRCFLHWTTKAAAVTEGRVVPIDGKTVRNSGDATCHPLHLVNAFCVENEVVLGSIATEEKSNEITAIPELLGFLHIDGAIVTIDAMGAQKKIVTAIRDKNADYVIACKKNQRTLFHRIEKTFQALLAEEQRKETVVIHEDCDTTHGRSVVRTTCVTDDLSRLETNDWVGLRSIVMTTTESVVKERMRIETRYYLSSLAPDAKEHARVIRSHWHIENKLHWVLDVAFREDHAHIHRDNGAQNLSLVRHAALNIIRNDKSVKLGVKNKRLKAGWDDNYRSLLLFGKESHA